MSTLAWELAGTPAPVIEPDTNSSRFRRLVKAREDQAKRRVLAYLAAMDDARLRNLGFSDANIKELRMRLPR